VKKRKESILSKESKGGRRGEKSLKRKVSILSKRERRVGSS
jgi:hypothetical protein